LLGEWWLLGRQRVYHRISYLFIAQGQEAKEGMTGFELLPLFPLHLCLETCMQRFEFVHVGRLLWPLNAETLLFIRFRDLGVGVLATRSWCAGMRDGAYHMEVNLPCRNRVRREARLENALIAWSRGVTYMMDLLMSDGAVVLQKVEISCLGRCS
jgi:hypothetical protein